MTLREELGAYLSTRRALGYALTATEYLAGQFCDWLAERGKTDRFTIGDAVEWARSPAGAQPVWWSHRLTVLRPFAAYLNASGWDVPVIPRGMLPRATTRTEPFIYSQEDLDTLLEACPAVFPNPRIAATMSTIVGLLAATGIRIGEALALKTPDFDTHENLLLIRGRKTPLDRLVPLHPTTTAALSSYLAMPERLATRPDPDGPVFVNYKGAAFGNGTIEQYYRRLTRAAGIEPRGRARPRLHDWRHTLPTSHMAAAYRNNVDPQRTLTLLATWLGHTNVADTYWYVSATPELMALAAQRIEQPRHTEGRP
jgi:integrase